VSELARRREQSPRRSGEPQRELVERFHREHDELQGMLRALRERVRDAAARTGTGGGGARARSEAESLAGELEQRLPQYFTAEERVGFLSEAVNQAPRLSRRADALRAECAQLAEGLSALRTRMRSAGRATRRWQDLDAECRRFAEAYHDHESRENQLIHEAWSVDVGSVD
jgi:predicted RNase H-like nuclease (RuvC/YqgF family)